MVERFDILCNNCGKQVVFRPFQEFAICSACNTYLKLEETERTVLTLIVDKNEFLKTQQTPISTGQHSFHQRQQELQEYQNLLTELEKDWKEREETFKIKNNKKRILPRKRQSLLFTIIGSVLILLNFFLWRSSNFLVIIGVVWLFSSGREYYKAIKYEKAKQDFEDEKEQLQMAIDLLQ